PSDLHTQKWHPKSSGHFFVLQPESGEEDMDDLCDLPAVTETSVLEALRQRFYDRKIYTYISSILVAVNPNKYLPVYYNPKYVKMYENQPLGKLSPHIFAMADVSFRAMLGRQRNQCILLSGETGSGKTESSGFLIHCLTALSQKTSSTGLDRTILGSGPVLEVRELTASPSPLQVKAALGSHDLKVKKNNLEKQQLLD
uniref:Myosin motor domain-containing protein n=1 Tax=Oryzias sinensis TaxID=183150 RepID=A0A8C7WV73_9TELE